jgi:hypothetical protein
LQKRGLIQTKEYYQEGKEQKERNPIENLGQNRMGMFDYIWNYYIKNIPPIGYANFTYTQF